MKAASVNTLKQELEQLPVNLLVNICVRLARYKKDNKELLTYLLFEADDVPGYIANVIREMDELFEVMNTSNLYLAKKSLRKILRIINKYVRYTLSKVVEVELLLHYTKKIKDSGIRIAGNTALNNLYNNQLKKITNVIPLLHEDLQFDYSRLLDSLN